MARLRPPHWGSGSGRRGGKAHKKGRSAYQNRREDRFSLLYRIQKYSNVDRVCACHVRPKATEAGVQIALRGDVASYVGVQKCDSWALCPVCGAKIANTHAEQIAEAGKQWLGLGGSLYEMTFTIPHSKADSLGDTWDDLKSVWTKTFNSHWWRGAREQFSIEGWVRVWETTVGEESGWHPHGHALFFCDRQLSGRERRAFLDGMDGRDGLYATLRKRVADLGRRTPKKSLFVLNEVRSLRDLAGYMVKIGLDEGGGASGRARRHVANGETSYKPEGSARVQSVNDGMRSIAQELARGDLKRKGKGIKPLDLIPLYEQDKKANAHRLAQWYEFEEYFDRKRQLISWSRDAESGGKSFARRFGFGEDDAEDDAEIRLDAGSIVFSMRAGEFAVLVACARVARMLSVVEEKGPEGAAWYLDRLKPAANRRDEWRKARKEWLDAKSRGDPPDGVGALRERSADLKARYDRALRVADRVMERTFAPALEETIGARVEAWLRERLPCCEETLWSDADRDDISPEMIHSLKWRIWQPQMVEGTRGDFWPMCVLQEDEIGRTSVDGGPASTPISEEERKLVDSLEETYGAPF